MAPKRKFSKRNSQRIDTNQSRAITAISNSAPIRSNGYSTIPRPIKSEQMQFSRCRFTMTILPNVSNDPTVIFGDYTGASYISMGSEHKDVTMNVTFMVSPRILAKAALHSLFYIDTEETKLEEYAIFKYGFFAMKSATLYLPGESRMHQGHNHVTSATLIMDSGPMTASTRVNITPRMNGYAWGKLSSPQLEWAPYAAKTDDTSVLKTYFACESSMKEKIVKYTNKNYILGYLDIVFGYKFEKDDAQAPGFAQPTSTAYTTELLKTMGLK